MKFEHPTITGSNPGMGPKVALLPQCFGKPFREALGKNLWEIVLAPPFTDFPCWFLFAAQFENKKVMIELIIPILQDYMKSDLHEVVIFGFYRCGEYSYRR